MIGASSSLAGIASLSSGSWPWYTVRGTGFAGLFLLIVLMISGIGHATGLTYKFIEPVKAWAIHKAMGIMLLVAIGLHIFALYFDSFVSFSIANIIVPFSSSYTNGVKFFGINLGFVAVTAGILAMYGAILVVASSLGWIDSKKPLWRKLHYVSYGIVPLVFIHALGTGSDLKDGLARFAMLVIFVILSIAVASRMARHSK